MAQAIEILDVIENKDAFVQQWLLMTWQQKEPGHHQPCYWPSSSRTFSDMVNGAPERVNMESIYVISLSF